MNDAPADDSALTTLQGELYLLREELTGLREMLEGTTRALQGAQRAYAAVAQRADLLDERLRRVTRSPTTIGA